MLLSKGMRRPPSLASWLQTSEMLEVSVPFLMEVRSESRRGIPKLLLTLCKSLMSGLMLHFSSLGTGNEELRVLVSTKESCH